MTDKSSLDYKLKMAFAAALALALFAMFVISISVYLAAVFVLGIVWTVSIAVMWLKERLCSMARMFKIG